MKHSELERLALLAEECGEVQVAIGKILRHGWESVDPTCADSPTNRQFLETELGDVMYAMQLMGDAGDIRPNRVATAKGKAAANKPQWLHYQRRTS